MKRLLAALSFFTRMPFWKLADLNKSHYQNLVTFWPLAGWLTGGTMMIVFALSVLLLPISIAIILAFLSRVFLTGALHEDGFADFFDGFGGGKDRESILSIMKDSHNGTYGQLSLVLYFLLLYNVVESYIMIQQTTFTNGCFAVGTADFISMLKLATIFISADSFAKWTASNVINILPYARSEQQAKNKLLYNKMTLAERIFSFICGILPSILFLPFKNFIVPMLASSIVTMLLIFFFYKKINGYTGDCCGALFIISELTFYISSLILIYN